MNARSRAHLALPKIAVILALTIGPGLLRGDAPKPLFEEDVVPILETRCFKCHGAEKQEGGLDLRRKFKIAQGGDGGAALVPGKPGESLLIEKVVSKEMPPKGDDPLDDKQIEVLRRWIEQGAATKTDPEPPLEAADSESTLSEADRNWWSFQTPKRVDPPAVRDVGRVRTSIDAFLLAKLEEKNIGFNPDASKQVVLRRLAFDLTGLPPTPEMQAEFEADTADGAYERLVDKLLNSERFGEHWARHWLDVAGYADSDGYLDADRERPEAWRYRDYVIRAFNTDKSYDRFTLEQVAGDELSDWRRADELSSVMVDELTATGFLRTAVDPTYGGWKEKVEINKVIADTIQIVGSTYFGLTIQCARCHQHKHDPLSQRDYYSLAAVLGAAYDPEPARWLVSLERAVPLATESQVAKLKEWNGGIEQRVAKLNAEVLEIELGRRAKLIGEKLDVAGATSGLSKEDREALIVAVATPVNNRTADHKNRVAQAKLEEKLASITISPEEVNARWPDTPNEVARLKAAIAAENGLMKPLVMLRGIQDLADTAHPTHVLRRGDFNTPGRVVEPNVPTVLSTGTSTYAPQPGYKTTGRRAAFAKWLIDPRHPTTARVHVNRLWAIVFGRGLVDTVDDFGRLGSQPTHPELLDWLATEFINQGWSQKKLLKLMVTSTAYRQSSALDPAKTAIDDANVLLGTYRPKRLTGEQLRDGLLAVSGKLDLKMFGPPTKVHLQGDGSVITTDDAAGNRRSIYLQVRRSEPVTLMDTFDTPRMEINCTRRTEATVPTQALTMLNSPFMQTTSKAFSQKILAAKPTRAERIEWAVRVAFGRAANDADRAALNSFLDDYAKSELGDQFATAGAVALEAIEAQAWPHAAVALLNANEFLYVE